MQSGSQNIFILKDEHFILNAKNLAPLSISIFFWFKMDYLKKLNKSIIQMMCPCRKIIFVTYSNALECMGIHRYLHISGETCQKFDFVAETFLKKNFLPR